MEFGSWMKYTQDDEWKSKQDIPIRFDPARASLRRSEEGWIRFKGKGKGKGIVDEGKGKGIVDEGKGKGIVVDEGKGKGKGIQEAAAA